MFTGIVEEVGKIKEITRGASSCRLVVGCSSVLSGTKVGDSICTSGVCLTAVEVGGSSFTADVMHETMDRSNLGELRIGSRVNLERAMAADGRFGGHIMSGHIDDTGTITAIRGDDIAVWYTIAASADVLRYIVAKGSIAVDGISLTVADISERDFKVSVIPHTRDATSLSDKRIGSKVNLECDIIGKYVEKLMTRGSTQAGEAGNPGAWETADGGKIDLEFLAECGF